MWPYQNQMANELVSLTTVINVSQIMNMGLSRYNVM